MSLATTSALAFSKVKLNKNEGLVFDALNILKVATNDQVADFLGWPVHCITGRMNGLNKKGYVKVVDLNGVSRMGNKAKRWASTNPNDDNLRLIAEQDCEA